LPLVLTFAFGIALLPSGRIAAAATVTAGNAAVDGDEPIRKAIESSDPIELIDVGIDGRFKVGSWTQVRIVLDASRLTVPVRVEIETVDGEGVPVIHADESLVESPGSGTIDLRRLVRIGRLRSRLFVRLVADDGSIVASGERLLDPAHGARASTDQLVLTLGPDIGFSSWLADRQGRFDDRATDLLTGSDPLGLPRDDAAFDAIDLMVIAFGDDPSLLDPATAPPWDSISRWTRRGGTLILVGATQAAPAAERLEIAALIPGSVGSIVAQEDSGGVEVFTSATDRLLGRGESYSLVELTELRGKMVAYESNGDRSLPLVVDSSCGMGRVVWIGADLAAEPFASWSSRNRFVGKVLEMVRAGAITSPTVRGSRVKHLGFDDLSGQLRTALDDFRRVSLVSFTSVAVIVVLFILLIGPVDWWFLSRVVRRMEWTWATSGAIVLTVTLLAIVGFRLTKGNQVLANQLEFVDVDGRTGEVRGTLWAHLYSPEVRTFDLELTRPAEFRSGEGRTLLGWQGLAGTGLGGMDVASGSGDSLGAYRFRTAADGSIRPTGIAVQVASTRSFVGRWWDRLATIPEDRLYLDRRNNSLHGEFTNPFPFTLDQAIVYYDTWAYVVNEDIQPGETISIETQTTERTAEGLLSRRRALQGAELSDGWDVASRSVHRIAEMLAFHRTAGGRDYTTLHHRVFGELDWSPQLKLGQAVVYARAATHVAELTDGGEPLEDAYDQRVSVIRLLLPVASDRSETRSQAGETDR